MTDDNEIVNTNNGGQRNNDGQPEVEPYKLSEIFSIVPEYEGDQIFLQTFLNACDCAYNMSTRNQKALLVIHIKNKLRGRAAQLISSRNPLSYIEIKQLLTSHFGDTRDLSSLIQDLQRVKQLPNESPLTFVNRVQVMNAKMHANIQKSPRSALEKQAQITLIESMALNTLLTGLEPRIGHIIRASNPRDILEAQIRIRRELQLSYFETQKVNKPIPPKPNHGPPVRKPTPNSSKCHTCGRIGHFANECRSRPFAPQNPSAQNFNYSQNSNNQNFARPPFNQNSNFQGNKPHEPQKSSFPSNQNTFQPRPSVIQRNPNFPNDRHRAHFVNYDYDYSYEQPYDEEPHSDYYQYDSNYYQYDSNAQSDYDHEQPIDQTSNQDYQDFPIVPDQNHPPNQSNSMNNSALLLESQVKTLNLDDMSPCLNFPEQNFL